MLARFAPLSLGLALGAAWAGCADFGADNDPVVGDTTGIAELAAPLTALAFPCEFAPVSGVQTMTIALADGETGVVSKRAVDSAMLVNGTQCGTATSATVKRIAVTGSSGTNTIIFDFINGSFTPGYGSGAGTPGITVDLVSGSNDAVKIRGSASADTVTIGADGISFNTDTVRDITVANVDEYVFSLGAGNDVFSASGGYGTGLPFATSVTAYGGEGNDVLSGGTGADTLYGGSGNDTLRGATDAALDVAADVLNGDDGDDTFDAGNASNGADTFNGGLGSDHVSYALRTVAVVVTIGVGVNDGEAGETDTVAGDIEILTGSSGDDTLTGGAGAETINGGPGNDTITGGDGNDTLNGNDGDDVFVAGALTGDGADVYNGGAGIDVVSYAARSLGVTVIIDGIANDGETGGTEGDNVKTDVEDIVGGSGDDILTGSASNNAFTGGPGNDIMSGLGGNDIFHEGATSNGGDQFIGGIGVDVVDYSLRTNAVIVTMDGVTADDGEALEVDDVEADVEDLWGGGGDDFITGNALANSIDGGSGIDTIHGGAGNDTLFGGAGVDLLYGDDGDDLLDGGAGLEVTIDCGAGDGDIAILGAGESGLSCEL